MKLRISAKCSDMCSADLIDENYVVLATKDGYAPDIPNLCSGDYIDFEIDITTGKIVGWQPQTPEEIINAIEDM